MCAEVSFGLHHMPKDAEEYGEEGQLDVEKF
jgi:hypothetical protein